MKQEAVNQLRQLAGRVVHSVPALVLWFVHQLKSETFKSPTAEQKQQQEM